MMMWYIVSASGTTVIGATGGDTNPPPLPDKKSKGAGGISAVETYL